MLGSCLCSGLATDYCWVHAAALSTSTVAVSVVGVKCPKYSQMLGFSEDATFSNILKPQEMQSIVALHKDGG